MVRSKNKKGIKAMNKKAFSYSFLALLFILVATLFFISDDSSMKEDAFYDARIVKSLDNRLDSVSEDIGRGIYIVGLRGVIALENIIISEEDYIHNLDDTFSEVFINGTYQSQELLVMQNSSLKNVTTKIEEAFKKDGIDIDIIPNSVKLDQESPWSVTITLNTTILMTDRTKIAHWNTTRSIKKDISIIELNDPIYYIESNGFVHNQILKTDVEYFVLGDDVTNLNHHLENSFYIQSSKAPSYLQRIQGDFSQSENGIESLVNLEEFVNQGLEAHNYSAVDYLYFSEESGDVQIQGMPDWFYLDSNHADDYNVTHIIK